MGNGKWDTAQRTHPSPARAQLTEGRSKASVTRTPKTAPWHLPRRGRVKTRCAHT